MQKFKGFTLIELVIALTLFSFVIVGIIFAVYKSYTYVQASKLQLIAVNLTREGVEAVYNIRDTNWRKYSGEKDKCWLKVNPYSDTCDSSELLFVDEGLYILNWDIESGYSLFWSNVDVGKYEMNEFFDDLLEMEDFKMNFMGSLSGKDLQDLMDKEADFYRVVRVFWLHSKIDWIPSCSTVDSCNNSNPKELRFCVKTFYVSSNAKKGFSELCAMLTNFLE